MAPPARLPGSDSLAPTPRQRPARRRQSPRTAARACQAETTRTGLLQSFQVGDDVVDILAVRQPAIRHAVTLHLGLRILDVRAQICFVPDQICALHRIRVAEILERGRFASDYAFEAR